MKEAAKRILKRFSGSRKPVLPESNSPPSPRVPPQHQPEGTFPETGFPPGRYFATLGELAENYGGTSSVVFHRSRAIVEQTGHPVDILTFGHLRDYERLTEEMLSDGRFAPGMRFRNMWSELSEMHPAGTGGARSAFPHFSPLTDPHIDETVEGEGVPLRRFRQDETGANLQIDMCRADGTVIVSDRRDVETDDGKVRKSVVLCDARGLPVKEFRSIVGLRNYWLDSVVGDDQAFLFSDTFGIAGYTHQYKRKNVVVVQTFHNHHLRHGAVQALDYTEKRYLPFLDNIDDFDATVLLTQRQKDDLEVLMGPSPQRWVIPNSRTVEPIAEVGVGSSTEPGGGPGDLRGDRSRAMCVGRLVAGKQVDQAVRAIVAANEILENPVHLDIYGEGSARGAIESTIDDLGTSAVQVRGHDSTAADKFAEASFSLLTSRSEAMSLVLVESMARGCIPIAYDVPYGPREIITHGVNGFLVEAGDIAALTNAIVDFQTLDDDRLSTLRANAIARAQDFSDAAIMRKWAELLRTTVAGRRSPEKLEVTGCVTTIDPSRTDMDLHVEFSSSRGLYEPRAHLVLKGRADPVLTRVECSLEDLGHDRHRASVDLDADRISWVTKGIIDAHLEVHDAAGRGTRRIPASRALKDGERYRLADFEVYATAHGSLSFKHM